MHNGDKDWEPNVASEWEPTGATKQIILMVVSSFHQCNH